MTQETGEITIAQFEDLIARSYDLKDQIEGVERDVLKPLREDLDAVDQRIIELMEKMEKTSYKSNSGTIVVQKRFTVQTPKTKDEKANFFQWLKGKSEDAYWQYVTIHSQSLNSLWKSEYEAAKERGEGLDFALPGIGSPTYRNVLSRRKK